jgi:hypothetical protein
MGSDLFFRKFNPLSGVPAGTELLTNGCDFASLAGAAAPSFFAEGVRGSLRGCAVAEPCDVGARPEGVDVDMGVAVAVERRAVVERKRGAGF